MNVFSQLAGIISGLLIMAGALLGYVRFKVNGDVATVVAIFGGILVAFGVGGELLLRHLMNQ